MKKILKSMFGRTYDEEMIDPVWSNILRRFPKHPEDARINPRGQSTKEGSEMRKRLSCRELEDAEVVKLEEAYRASVGPREVYEQPAAPFHADNFDGIEYVTLDNVHGIFAVFRVENDRSFTRLDRDAWPSAYQPGGIYWQA